MCYWAVVFLGKVGMRWAVVYLYFAWHEKRSLDLGRLALPDQVVAKDDPAKWDPHLLRYVKIKQAKVLFGVHMMLNKDSPQAQEPQILSSKDDQ